MKYKIRFDFDCEGEPPTVLIWEVKPGYDVIEVMETPLFKGADYIDESTFLWEPEDWTPGPLAQRVMDLLNQENGDETARLGL